MLERFRRHLQETGLIPPGSRVLVGYSGGADSTCLLHLCALLGLDLVAGHLHHGQRPEAEQELEMCRDFALELGTGFISGQADVPRMSQDLKVGLEEAGRKARYAFFEQASRQYNCDRIATAHTRSDHVETVLHHLIRGSGLTGLSGIAAVRANLIRPLLIFERSETRAYCLEHGLPFHDDPANSDLSFARARIRHRILPEILAINPAAEEAIARLADFVAKEDRFLNGVAAASLETSELPLNGQLSFLTKDVEVAFQRERLASLPEVVVRRAIRLAVEALGAQFDSHETATFMAVLGEGASGSVTAIGGAVVVELDQGTIHVRQVDEAPPFKGLVSIPGDTVRSDQGWRMSGVRKEGMCQPAERTALTVELPVEVLRGDLFFRNAAQADRIQPLGFTGHRKLSDLLSEARLTQAARSRLPVVCDLIGPLWVPGVCLDDRATRPASSNESIALTFGPV